MVGRRIVTASEIGLAGATLAAVADVLWPTGAGGVAAGADLICFFVSLPVWVVSFGLALSRSTRGDDIAVASWVFLAGGAAPTPVRRRLLGVFAGSVVLAAATAWANPFVVLVPMLPLGFAALWGARYGTFPQQSGVRVGGSPR